MWAFQGVTPSFHPSGPLVLQVFFHHPFSLAPDLFSQERVTPFSHNKNRGRTWRSAGCRCFSAFLISFTILICSINKPERAPERPARFPATDKSWQGEPPQMISTGGSSAPWSFVISPTWIMSGNRCLVTSMGKASISLAHTGMIPLWTAAKGNPPIPSNKLPRVSVLIWPPPGPPSWWY